MIHLTKKEIVHISCIAGVGAVSSMMKYQGIEKTLEDIKLIENYLSKDKNDLPIEEMKTVWEKMLRIAKNNRNR